MKAPAAWLRRVQWPRGARAALAVGSALLASHALGLSPAAAALGAFNPLLVDNGGPYRPRLTTMSTTILGGAIAYILGAILPPHIALVVLVTAMAAFAITFARVLSQPLASSSVLILVLYFAGLGGTVHKFHGATFASVLIVAGGIWSVVLSLVLWPIDPFRPARLSVASCYEWMSRFTQTLGASEAAEVEAVDPGFEWRRQQRVRIEAARTALASTAARAPSRTVRARSLTVLLETSDMLLARTLRLAELKAAASRLSFDEAEAAASDIIAWLSAAELVIFEALAEKPADAAESLGREGSYRLQFITRRKQKLPLRTPSDDSLLAHLLTEERNALLELEIAFDAVRALWTGSEPPASDLVSPSRYETGIGWRDAIEANWDWQSAALRHALRMTVVGVVDVVVMRLIHINHGFWLPMTSIILLQPFSAGTVRKSVQRVTGTIAGGILAAMLAAAITQPMVMLSIITALSALTVATFAVDYAVYCFFLTPTFVLLSLPHTHDWRYASVRVGTTLAGALIAILAMRLLWPERADEELAHLLRRGAEASSAYLETLLKFWQLAPAARSAGERELLAPARRACGLASNDAEEAIDRLMQEPSLGRRADAETILRTESLRFVTYLRRLTQSITTLALVGSSSPEAEARLLLIVTRLGDLSNAQGMSSGSLVGSESQSSKTDVAEEQMQRIERQTSVLERSAAALWGAPPESEALAAPDDEQRNA